MSTELKLSYQQAVDFYRAGQLNNAIAVYKSLLQKNPNHAQAHAELGICYLSLGNFRQGWSEYEWRLRTQDFTPPESQVIPFWNGEPISKVTILVNPEQGYGDTIQFVRYLPLLKARGCQIIFGCHQPLHRLMANVTDVVLSDGALVPPFQCQVALMSLPLIFGTDLNTIPSQIPYLSVPITAQQKATEIVQEFGKCFRIGVVWRGNMIRTLPFEFLSKLWSIPNAQFFSLQVGAMPNELKLFPEKKLVDLGKHIQDFADTAAFIQSMDLIISVDTSVAHLAGALGKLTWTLLPFVPDWRWMLDREDSPWYPTMRLFRQPRPGDWASVITRVTTQLTELVQKRGQITVSAYIY